MPMDASETFLTPVARLVQGSLYTEITKDPNGDNLIYKSGKKKGQPRISIYFSVAILKGKEKHWSETKWGKIIWDAASKAYAGKIPQQFAWKIIDGDSKINFQDKEYSPSDKEGWAGHWVMSLTSDRVPRIFTKDAETEITEKDKIKLGDYIQVAGIVNVQRRQSKPGVFLNHDSVAFIAVGKRITLPSRIDPKTVGFGGDVPEGALLEETIEENFTSTDQIEPYNDVFSVDPPPAANENKHTMTSKAKGSYDDYKKAGWTDQQLVQHGFMVA